MKFDEKKALEKKNIDFGHMTFSFESIFDFWVG